MSKQVAEVLDKARQRLIDKGWCKGTELDEYGRCCALGAIERSARSQQKKARCRMALREAAGCGLIEMWNDSPIRTKAQVLGAFKRAANAERKSTK